LDDPVRFQLAQLAINKSFDFSRDWFANDTQLALSVLRRVQREHALKEITFCRIVCNIAAAVFVNIQENEKRTAELNEDLINFISKCDRGIHVSKSDSENDESLSATYIKMYKQLFGEEPEI